MAVACQVSADDPGADGGSDEPQTPNQFLCAKVGAAVCAVQFVCRGQPVESCETRFAYYHCSPPEPLSETTAEACVEKWNAWADNCPALWAARIFDQTAPTCAALTLPGGQ